MVPLLNSCSSVRVLVIGISTLDLHIRNLAVPATDGHAYLSDYKLSLGGSAANMAMWLAGLGVDVSLMTAFADDFAGDFLRNCFAEQRIRLVGNSRIAGTSTAFSIINVADDGRIGLLHYEGANDLVGLQSLSGVDIADYDVVHIAGALSMKSFDGHPMAQLAKVAKSHGKQVSLHTSRNTDKKSLLFEVLPNLDMIFLNEAEAREISGEFQPEKAACWFKQHGVGTVAITLGAKGAYVSNATANEFVPALEIAVVDTTGCGDAFAAGFVYAAGLNASLRLRTAWGNVVAAYCARTLGATQSSFSLADLKPIFESYCLSLTDY